MTDDDARRCIVCHHRELADDEPQTCRRCVQHARTTLGWVARLFPLLRVEIEGRAGRAPTPGGRRSSDGAAPVAFAELLSLMGPGSDGGAHDATADDAPSVAWELSRWEDDWRSVMGRPGAPCAPSVVSAHDFLAVNLSWAANWHPAFGEFVGDVRRLLGRLRSALQMMDNPLPMGADCFECGDRLVRDYAPPQPCSHPGEHASSCDQGGLRDHVRCEGCGTIYTPPQYALALAAALQAAKGEDAAA